MTLDGALLRFAQREPLVDVWRRVPDIDDGEDNEACETLAPRFTAYALEHDLDARTIKAQFDRPFVDTHAWTAIRVADDVINVDWTARQFHDLWVPSQSWLQDLPCPLVWVGERVYHPLLGDAVRPENPLHVMVGGVEFDAICRGCGLGIDFVEGEAWVASDSSRYCPPTMGAEHAPSRWCTDPRHDPDNPCVYDGCAACEAECRPPNRDTK